MRLDYIEPFIEATNCILEDVFKMPAQKGKLSLHSEPITSKGLVVVIGLTGDVEGRVLFDMEPDTTVEMACIMNKSKFDSIQPMVMDSIGELVNMIMGKALTILNDKGFNFKLTPPMVFSGNAVMSSAIRIETLIVPFTTKFGELMINIAVRPVI